MSNAAAIESSAPASPARPQARRRGLRISIRFKFVSFTVLLIAAVMAVAGYSLYSQQRSVLSREVIGRGRTVGENLAAASKEPLLLGDTLPLVLLATKAVEQSPPRLDQRMGTDLARLDDIVAGLKGAWTDLQSEVPRVLELNLSELLGRPLDWGFAGVQTRKSGGENEGIVEAVIVDNNGNVAAHYKGASLVGQPYKAPAHVSEGTPDVPYPIYELEVYENGQRYVRRLFHLVQPIVENSVSDAGTVQKQVGTVHLGVDEYLVSSLIFKVTMKLIAIGIVAALLGIVFTYLLVSWMTNPIGRLGDGVASIAGGDFNTQVKVSSKDELGELTSAFNNMAVSLSQNEMLKGAFTRYVSDAALKQILADPGKTGLHSRRTMATIYSSDVRGFTSMSESLEPEQVVQVINSYLSLQTEIILKHGGVVDKFIGDATIGVWGKEEPHPDDALNAVRAAFEAQRAIEQLNQERAARGEIVKLIGIGVNSGEVVSGNMGSSKKMEYTVTGEHVIFAERICDGCEGGKVLISESTYALVKDRVLVEAAELKGKDGHGQGTKVYLVTGFR